VFGIPALTNVAHLPIVPTPDDDPMKHSALAFLLLLLVLVSRWAHAQPDYSFSYQGLLKTGSELANGDFDLHYSLYDGPELATAILLGTVTQMAVPVQDGLYNVLLDFGDAFSTAEARWLQVPVRESGTQFYLQLVPMTYLAAVPYASFAWKANHALSATNAEYAVQAAATLQCFKSEQRILGSPQA
jgi:hypothetical protein